MEKTLMEHYDHVAQLSAQLVTTEYSSSFGLATKAFAPTIRKHIYNIYGLVRVADEIVDTYSGHDQLQQLDSLEQELYDAMARGYSTNLVAHAFQLTAIKYGISKQLITPFFESMRSDISVQSFTTKQYATYIHGSAEVIGLMCLKVFVGDESTYKQLETGAAALGAAFQKVNFLRDVAFDQNQLHRFYFPNCTFDSFNEAAKQAIIKDIYNDFTVAKVALDQLPKSVRTPILAAYRYFYALLQKLEKTSIDTIKQRRVRINDGLKLAILTKTVIGQAALPSNRK